jgi:hypothetical protein
MPMLEVKQIEQVADGRHVARHVGVVVLIRIGQIIPAAIEAFAQNIIELAQSNPTQWAETAIFVTVDEGGGYYDSGFIQPVDFFGTGPRIPMIAVSPFSTGGQHSVAIMSAEKQCFKRLGLHYNAIFVADGENESLRPEIRTKIL